MDRQHALDLCTRPDAPRRAPDPSPSLVVSTRTELLRGQGGTALTRAAAAGVWPARAAVQVGGLGGVAAQQPFNVHGQVPAGAGHDRPAGCPSTGCGDAHTQRGCCSQEQGRQLGPGLLQDADRDACVLCVRTAKGWDRERPAASRARPRQGHRREHTAVVTASSVSACSSSWRQRSPRAVLGVLAACRSAHRRADGTASALPSPSLSSSDDAARTTRSSRCANTSHAAPQLCPVNSPRPPPPPVSRPPPCLRTLPRPHPPPQSRAHLSRIAADCSSMPKKLMRKKSTWRATSANPSTRSRSCRSEPNPGANPTPEGRSFSP